MIRLIERAESAPTTVTGTLHLPVETRMKSRFRATLDTGDEVGVFLERGGMLRDGSALRADSGEWVTVRAAPEPVSTVYCEDPLLLARAAYHLGNRHIALQIDPGRLRYLHDHVLDDMLRGIGLDPIFEHAPFEPEAGAYGHGHAHGGHGHGHSH
ncbi:urease accessory protein UreE [Thioalkalivibrio sp. ALgr3]|uniref:urease accessory protein UreE n=1 Tax=Thioalkalivibrio sp. ALgr3 TaxID=1239292 RepID=UPI0003786E69|nr:urease accessory protein UreE [Thioalkalivibrio sp. ALgr3]